MNLHWYVCFGTGIRLTAAPVLCERMRDLPWRFWLYTPQYFYPHMSEQRGTEYLKRDGVTGVVVELQIQ